MLVTYITHSVAEDDPELLFVYVYVCVYICSCMCVYICVYGGQRSTQMLFLRICPLFIFVACFLIFF